MKHKTILLLLLVLFLAQSRSLAGQEDTVDTSFLGDTVLLFHSATLEDLLEGGRINIISLLSTDGIETIIERERSNNSCGDISPDGAQIAFYNARDLNGESADFFHTEIYVADIDGSGERRLTFNEDYELAPRWSPNGEYIVFMGSSSWEEMERFEIYIMDADGDNFEQLTDNDSADRFPSWSLDGERILFHSNRDGDYELYTMTPEGSDVEQLTDNDWDDTRAMYSPDDELIVFNNNRFGTESLFRMRADGNKIERLPTGEGLPFGAVWSPDGAMIAFMHTLDDEGALSEIWVMNADGSDARPVLAEPEVDYQLCDWGVRSD
jgi:Tol biopolymer transport system component